MEVLDRLQERARANPRFILLPEGEDERVLSAASRIAALGLARVGVVGKPASLETRASRAGIDLKGVELIDHLAHSSRQKYVEEYFRSRRHRGLTEQEADKALQDPLYFANIMVRLGEADGTVAGATNTTAHTVRAALQCLGLAAGMRPSPRSS
jgi:phosphate acetyltransferase